MILTCSLCGKPASHLIFTDRRSEDPIRNDGVNVNHCDEHTEEEINEQLPFFYLFSPVPVCVDKEKRNVVARPGKEETNSSARVVS